MQAALWTLKRSGIRAAPSVHLVKILVLLFLLFVAVSLISSKSKPGKAIGWITVVACGYMLYRCVLPLL
jgi:hypothetical protein